VAKESVQGVVKRGKNVGEQGRKNEVRRRLKKSGGTSKSPVDRWRKREKVNSERIVAS